MRKPLLSVGLVALLAGACGSANYAASPGGQYTAPPPEHHAASQVPPQPPAATPYDGVTFQDPGTNPFVDPRVDNESTFGLDVDTASYTVARRFISDGHLPDPASVRVEEFVNYFDQGYAAPEDEAFAIHVDGAPSPFLAGDEVLLRVGLKAREVAEKSRPAAALTFVIDVSGSMAREDRLGLVKQSLALLVEGLRRDDTVGIVVYGSEARVVLPPTSSRQSGTILDAINSLQPEGSTNAEAGLRLGYEMARSQLRTDGINRVVLASDGVANVGATSAEAILGEIRHDAETGIQLVTVGFGMGNFNDVLLERLADDGDGFYAYVDDIDEARRLFVDNLTGTLQSIALDARVQVDFSSELVEAYRLVGYENRAIADNQFRNDNVAAGAIGAGHSVTALYALRLSNEGGRQDRVATISLRWTDPDTGRAAEVARDVRLSDVSGSFSAAGSTLKLDAIVAATAERFRHSPWGDTFRLHDVDEVAGQVSEDLPQTQEVHDFLDLLAKAADLEG